MDATTLALMKTNPSARKILRIRRVVIGLAVVVMVGATFIIGSSLGTRVRQGTVRQTDFPQAPNMSVGDLFAAVH